MVGIKDGFKYPLAYDEDNDVCFLSTITRINGKYYGGCALYKDRYKQYYCFKTSAFDEIKDIDDEDFLLLVHDFYGEECPSRRYVDIELLKQIQDFNAILTKSEKDEMQ